MIKLIFPFLIILAILTTRSAEGCISPKDSISGQISGDQQAINKQLSRAGDVAVLCAGATFNLTSPVVFSANGQQIYTEGLPTDDRRAVLRVASPSITTAVDMSDRSDVVLSHVIVDGNRPNLGPMEGQALIQAGGSASGQVIREVKAFETRGWTILHLFEGEAPRCSDALVENNQFGPAGHSDDWADGISLACTNSVVRNNTIIDATDGGIVIFGAPGSVVEGNEIRAETRTLLGGINMVDYGPYNGNYTGTVVRRNVIDAAGAVIRIGLGMGPRVWGCAGDDPPEPDVFGAVVTENTLRGENMQYGYAVDGVRDWTVTDNVDEATHSGTPTVDCMGQIPSPPAGFQYHSARAAGVFQAEFEEADLELALWAIEESLSNTLKTLADSRDIRFGAIYQWDFRGGLYDQLFEQEMNTMTAGIFMEDGSRPSRTEFDFSEMDMKVNWGRARGLDIHGHILVWYDPVHLPDWVKAAPKTEVEAIINEHIDAVVKRYAGKIKVWDVVNEPVNNGSSTLRRGHKLEEAMGDDYIRKAFVRAHAADPNAILRLNEYDIENNTESEQAKFEGVKALLVNLKKQGAPVHALGWQMHLTLEEGFDAPTFLARLNEIAGMGFDNYISELDVVLPPTATAADYEQQKQIYKSVIQTFLASRRHQAIVVWGLRDGEQYWFPENHPLLFDENLKKKPAYFGVQEALMAEEVSDFVSQ